jgi:hypothetical protein
MFDAVPNFSFGTSLAGRDIVGIRQTQDMLERAAATEWKFGVNAEGQFSAPVPRGLLLSSPS